MDGLVAEEQLLRDKLKQEISRLTDDGIAAAEIRDDEPLFSIPGECESRIELDSLDGLELWFAVEQEAGIEQPQDVEIVDVATVDAIMNFVRRLRAGPVEAERGGSS